jgi:hypothetical protein
MPEHERRRDQALVQQPLLAVEIRGDGVEQPRLLLQAARERRPFAADRTKGSTSSVQGRLRPSGRGRRRRCG